MDIIKDLKYINKYFSSSYDEGNFILFKNKDFYCLVKETQNKIKYLNIPPAKYGTHFHILRMPYPTNNLQTFLKDVSDKCNNQLVFYFDNCQIVDDKPYLPEDMYTFYKNCNFEIRNFTCGSKLMSST